MNNSRIKRNTALFVFFLLLGGFLHVIQVKLDPLTDTMVMTATHFIYTGLITAWMISVNRRLLPSAARRYMLCAAGLMIFYMAVRLFKYRIATDSVLLQRYGWYLYYIPNILIPVLFAMSCISIEHGQQHRRWVSAVLIGVSLVLVMVVLLNDVHRLVFIPTVDMSALYGQSGGYTYGVLFYAVYAWIALMYLLGVLGLIRTQRHMQEWQGGLLFLLSFVLWIVMFVTREVFEGMVRVPFNVPEINIFMMLWVFELCIRRNLIPSNRNYAGFFSALQIPAEITDRHLQPVYRTAVPVEADSDKMRQALREAVYLSEDRRLSGVPVAGGYAFLQTDESVIRKLNETLQDANETLSMENEILERENRLTSEKAAIEERNRLYEKAAKEVYPIQKRIADILAEAKPGTEDFREKIARALVLTTYVKRKSNFILLENERSTVTGDELYSAVRETAHYLGYCGMDITVNAGNLKDLPVREAIRAYDILELTAEQLYRKARDLLVRISEEGIVVMADTMEVPVLPVPAYIEDDQLVIKISFGGGI